MDADLEAREAAVRELITTGISSSAIVSPGKDMTFYLLVNEETYGFAERVTPLTAIANQVIADYETLMTDIRYVNVVQPARSEILIRTLLGEPITIYEGETLLIQLAAGGKLIELVWQRLLRGGYPEDFPPWEPRVQPQRRPTQRGGRIR